MHVLFVHPNFPAQFRCIAPRLTADFGWTCTFATNNHTAAPISGVDKVFYTPRGRATRGNHFCTRAFEDSVGHAHGVYEGMKARPDIRPDLVVAHSGFGSSLFLPYLYDAPIINFFEYFYRSVGQDLGYRPETPVTELMLLRSKARNAMILLDLENCDRGWCPNQYQRGLFPEPFRDKIDVMPEGIDTSVYRRDPTARLRMADGSDLPPGTRVVTYVSRGFELMRGFDVFMKAAGRICREMSNVIFVVVGSDRVCYGGEKEFIREKSFREHVLHSGDYDLSRFCFAGSVPERTLAEILSVSDLHVYLTVPFVPSWSLLDAMSCACVVLASDQACVREYITPGRNGLLCDFFDDEGIARQAMAVLRDPVGHRPLGEAARLTIERDYSLEVCLPRIRRFFESVASGRRAPSLIATRLVRAGTLPVKRDLDRRAEGRRPDGRNGAGTLDRSLSAPGRPRPAPNARPEPRRVLFCWELGAGLGHMVPMLPLAEALSRRGHDVSVALRNCAGAAKIFGRAGVRFFQAPYRSGGKVFHKRTVNFAHILGNTGWGDDGELFGLASAWRNLMRQVRPDVLVLDYSPLALLAARALRPTVKKVVTGLGFFCPPDVSPFPSLLGRGTNPAGVALDEQRVLARANRLLTHWSLAPLQRLGQLFGEVDETFLQTFRELDHYPDREERPEYWGPVHAAGGIVPRWPGGDGKRVYAYLKPFPALEKVLTALADLGGPTIVLTDRVDESMHRRFASGRIRFETARLDLQRVGAECDLAVHNANHGTLCQLLLKGVPMLQAPTTLEQCVLARAVERLGAAETVAIDGKSAADDINTKLRRLGTGPSYAESARRFAKEHESFDPAAQVRRMVVRVEGLMAGARPGAGRAKVFAG